MSPSDPPQTAPPASQPPGYFVPYATHADDEINLRQLWATLMERKGLIVLFTSLVVLATAAVALLMTPIYRAEALLQPVTEQKSGGLAGLAGNLGGLAALAGISLDGSGGGDKSVSIATLKSRALTEQFIKDKDLLPVLFYQQWDEEKKDWKTTDNAATPTLQDGFRVFELIRMVSEDKKTGLLTLAIEWRDPRQARDWVDELVKRTNSILREKALAEAQKNMDFLEQQIRQTSLIEVRQTIFSLMESQLKKIMLAKGNDQFAFKVIDPAVVPEKKIKPKRTLMVALGAMVGLFISIFYVLLLGAVRQPLTQKSGI